VVPNQVSSCLSVSVEPAPTIVDVLSWAENWMSVSSPNTSWLICQL
jgi:hypothetical protein